MKRKCQNIVRLMEDRGIDDIQELAQMIDIHRATLGRRLSGQADWTGTDIRKTCAVLGISRDKIGDLFFPDVPN